MASDVTPPPLGGVSLSAAFVAALILLLLGGALVYLLFSGQQPAVKDASPAAEEEGGEGEEGGEDLPASDRAVCCLPSLIMFDRVCLQALVFGGNAPLNSGFALSYCSFHKMFLPDGTARLARPAQSPKRGRGCRQGGRRSGDGR